jgi:hypothetical protein
MDIQAELQQLQGKDLESLKIEIENILRNHQQALYLLRQFLEPAVKNNRNCPDQIFNPLT